MTTQPPSHDFSVFDLSPAEKLQLVEDLWDDLASTADAVPIHDWQKAEIARRKANLMSNPASPPLGRCQGPDPTALWPLTSFSPLKHTKTSLRHMGGTKIAAQVSAKTS